MAMNPKRLIVVRGRRADRAQSISQLLFGLERFFDRIDENAVTAARTAGNMLLLETLPFTPRKTGALRNSGQVEVIKGPKRGRNRKLRVEVSFGDPDGSITGTVVDYAVYVHENKPNPPTDKNYTTPGTGPKFLTKGANAARSQISAMFNAEMAKSTRGV